MLYKYNYLCTQPNPVLIISTKLVAVQKHDVQQHFAVVIFADTLVLGDLAVFVVITVQQQKWEHSVHIGDP